MGETAQRQNGTSFSDTAPSPFAPASVVGITVLMWGVYIIYLAVFNYLADGECAVEYALRARNTDKLMSYRPPSAAYLIYASSALAAQSFARNIFAFAFPLFVEQM